MHVIAAIGTSPQDVAMRQRLSYLREMARLKKTQQDMAGMLGISQKTVSRLLSEHRIPHRGRGGTVGQRTKGARYVMTGPVAALRAARLKQQRSADEIGARCGFVGQSISRWERGVAVPSLANFIAWAQELGMPLPPWFESIQ